MLLLTGRALLGMDFNAVDLCAGKYQLNRVYMYLSYVEKNSNGAYGVCRCLSCRARLKTAIFKRAVAKPQ